MKQITLEISERLYEQATENAKYTHRTAEEYFQDMLTVETEREYEEILDWKNADIFPLTIYMPNDKHDPLEEIAEDEGGGIVHESDLDDDITF